MSRDEIRSYFDVQVSFEIQSLRESNANSTLKIIKLFDLIDKQLTRLQTKFPQEQVVRTNPVTPPPPSCSSNISSV